jgi:hypothetical protein
MNKLRPVLDDVKVEATSIGANLREEARSLKDEAMALKEGTNQHIVFSAEYSELPLYSCRHFLFLLTLCFRSNESSKIT